MFTLELKEKLGTSLMFIKNVLLKKFRLHLYYAIL